MNLESVVIILAAACALLGLSLWHAQRSLREVTESMRHAMLSMLEQRAKLLGGDDDDDDPEGGHDEV